jgi:hypothetical protein
MWQCLDKQRDNIILPLTGLVILKRRPPLWNTVCVCVCPSLFMSLPILTFSAFAISLSHSRDLFQLQRGENLFPDECDPCLWRHVLPLSCRLKKPLDFSILSSLLLLHSFTFHLSHSIYLLPTLSRKKLHSLPWFLFFFLKRNFKKQRLRPINISYNFSFSFSLQLHPKNRNLT